METQRCSFCGHQINPGTGMMYVKKTGQTFHFCSSKCRKNMIDLRRVPARTEWTEAAQRARK